MLLPASCACRYAEAWAEEGVVSTVFVAGQNDTLKKLEGGLVLELPAWAGMCVQVCRESGEGGG
jgi:hypothetical protein